MKKKYICSLCFIFYCGIFFAQDVKPEILTLNMALESAKKLNPELLNQKIILESATRENKSVWNNFLPKLSVDGGISMPHGQGVEPSLGWSASAGLSLSLSVATGPKIKQSALAYDIALLNFYKTEKKVLSSIEQTYYSLIAEKKNINILQTSLMLAESSYNQVLQNYNRGLVSELDMLNARYAYHSIQPNLESAISKFAYNLSNFAITVGKDGQRFSIEENLEIPIVKLSMLDGEKLCEKYLLKRIDIKLKELALENARLTLKMQKTSTQVPTIRLSESLSLREKAEGLALSGSFSVSTSIPLSSYIPGSETANSIANKEDSVLSAERDLENTKNVARNDISKKAAEVNRLWNMISLAEMNRSIAIRSHELSNEGYNAGLVSRTDFDNARQKMTKAEQDVISAKLSYFNAVYDLALALEISIEELYETMGVK
ncbi:MAG: TolC family protein [Treponema sp.]|nr:TolC family protein [Treponema sp.]